MSDTPTISDAFEQAQSTLTGTNEDDSQAEMTSNQSEAEHEEVDEVEEVDQENENDQNEEDDSFTDLDPEKLPPELKQVYKNLNKGFTQARQKDREEVKEYQKKMEELEKKLESIYQPKQVDQKPRTVQERIQESVKQQMQQERVKAYEDQAIDIYRNFDPRLNDKNEETHDPMFDDLVGAKMDLWLEKHLEDKGDETTFNVEQNLKKAVSQVDEYLKSKYKSYLNEQKKKAKSAAKKFGKQHPKTRPGKSKKGKMSLGEALQAALDKQS